MLLSNHPLSRNVGSLVQEAMRRTRAGNTASFLLLTSTRERARNLTADFVCTCSGRALGPLAIMTPQDFATELLEAIDPSIRLLSDAELGVFVELAIGQLQQEGALKYFETRRVVAHGLPVAPGTLEEIVNTIRKLREQALEPSDLNEQLAQLAGSKYRRTELRRSRDIHAIYERYLALIGDKFVDSYGQSSLLSRIDATDTAVGSARVLARAYDHAFGDAQDIFVDGFVRLEPSAYALLKLFAQAATITIEIPEVHEREEIYSPLAQFSDDAFAAGFVYSSSVDPTTTAANDRGAMLDRELRMKSLDPVKHRDHIRIVRAPSVREEIDGVAGAIKRILESDPIARADPSRICVASFLERHYTAHARSTFERFGIPASVTDRYRLEHNALTASLVGVFELVSLGYRRRELRRVLTSRYFEFRRPSGEPIDAATLIDISEEERLSGNYSEWQQRISALVQTAEAELRALGAVDEYADYSDANIRRARQRKQRLIIALQDYRVVTDIVERFSEPFTPVEFRDAVFSFFAEAGVRHSLMQNGSVLASSGQLERDARGYGTLVRLIDELMGIFALLEIDHDKQEIGFYAERLRAAAQLSRFTPRFVPGSVVVTSIDQALGLHFDYLFIVGLTDGIFPSRYERQPFLLSDLQSGGERQRYCEERLLFYTVLTHYRKQLWLSWPMLTDGDTENSRSTFLADFTRRLHLEEHVLPAPTTIDTRGALHRFAGREFSDTGRIELENIPNEFHPELTRLAHSATIQLDRVRARETEFTGYIDRNALTDLDRQALERMFDRTWSVQQLEAYAKCPFRYFAEKLLDLDVPAQTEEGISKQDSGHVIHEVLAELFAEPTRHDHPVALMNETEAHEFAREATSRLMQKVGVDEHAHPFVRLDAELILGEATERPLWSRLIEAERYMQDAMQRPAFFEVSFGMEGGIDASPLSRDEPISFGRLKLRGRIDRIDLDDDTYSIVDYKTGGFSNFAEINSGLSLQLAIYTKVAAELLADFYSDGRLRKGVGAVYESLKEGRRKFGLVLKDEFERRIGKLQSVRSNSRGVLTEEQLDVLIAKTIERAEQFVEGIAHAEFPLTTRDQIESTCKYCAIKSACRYAESKEFSAFREPARVELLPSPS